MAPTRASLLPVLSFLLLAALASASVEDICKKITTVDHAGVKYDFCVKSLKADPSSATADERGIAVIAGHLGSNKARSTLAKINSLLKTAPKPLSIPLKDCQELYDESVDKLSAAADAAKANKYSDANIFFVFGMDTATTCETGFKEKKLSSPLVADDNELFQLCAIGTAITHTGP